MRLEIKYSIGKATEKEIYYHFLMSSDDFFPPLAEKVNIVEYSSKIREKAITFEAWIGDELIGLVACYFNDSNKVSGFITNVSTLKEFSGMGIAYKLLSQCIHFAKENMFKELKLQVFHENATAIRLYEKSNFTVIGRAVDLINMKIGL